MAAIWAANCRNNRLRGRTCTSVTCPAGEFRIRIKTMRTQMTPFVAALLCGAGLCVSWAQEEPRQNPTSSPIRQGTSRNLKTDRTLTPDDRLSVIAAALDSKLRLYSEHDCSHLVHAIYERAGFSYDYASSSDLYVGIEGFQRVALPQTGDLVVWRGHVGIVIRPSHHVFFSFLHGGPGIDNYEAPYWTSRGHPRFYRYVKNSTHARSVRLRHSD
jgi:hypothetical protein